MIRPILCLEGDLKNDSKIFILKKTLENLQIFLHNLIKVHPSSTIEIQDDSSGIYSTGGDKTVTDSDLYVYVYARPFGEGSSTLGSAGSYLSSSASVRPTSGFLNVNFNNFPTEHSNLTDSVGDSFDVFFHEICHALGITSEGFKTWEGADGSPLGENYYHTCTKDDKTFKFLHTPKVVAVIKDHFGITGDSYPAWSSCKVGLELEDNDGAGTGGSH